MDKTITHNKTLCERIKNKIDSRVIAIIVIIIIIIIIFTLIAFTH